MMSSTQEKASQKFSILMDLPLPWMVRKVEDDAVGAVVGSDRLDHVRRVYLMHHASAQPLQLVNGLHSPVPLREHVERIECGGKKERLPSPTTITFPETRSPLALEKLNSRPQHLREFIVGLGKAVLRRRNRSGVTDTEEGRGGRKEEEEKEEEEEEEEEEVRERGRKRSGEGSDRLAAETACMPGYPSTVCNRLST
eukprot:762919-Hanusia_phi.AAC.6